MKTRNGGVRLYHTATPKTGKIVQTKNTLDEHAVVVRESPDGRGGWGPATEVKLRGKPHLKTFVVAQPVDDDGSGPAPVLYAGYEGSQSNACLASSIDGINFETLQPTYDFPKTKSQCAENRPSFLSLAADAYVTPTVGYGRDVVWYRNNFGTSFGWREIRGLQVVELKLCKTKGIWQRVATTSKGMQSLPSLRLANVSTSLLLRKHRLVAWYLDRLGKLERYRRQLYSVQLTRHSDGLFLGLATVLEWPKDTDVEPRDPSSPAFEHDTTNVYLVTSRDGVHIDDSWIYAQRPVLPKGALQGDWNSGMFLPAAQIVTDSSSHHVYYEARAGKLHHENRFDGPATIGVASWHRDRIVGVRQAHSRSPGILVTKAFALRGMSLLVDYQAAGTIAVDVLDAHGTVLDGFDHDKSSLLLNPRTDEKVATRNMTEVRWAGTDGLPSRNLGQIPAAAIVQLRFLLSGGAKLYSFQIGGARGAGRVERGGAAAAAGSRRTTRTPPAWLRERDGGCA